MVKQKFNYTDHFFAYADNSLGEFELKQFKSLMNFYLIFQDRLIVPDSFLINNKNLISLFSLEEYGYLKALEKGIIVPAVRQNISSIEELHNQFQHKDDAHSTIEYIRDIETASKKHRIPWNLEDIEQQFNQGVFDILDSAETRSPELGRLLHRGLQQEILDLRDSKGTFNRLDISNISKKYMSMDVNATRLFMGFVTAKYQTNIPDLLKLEIAYPQLEQNYVDNRDLIKETRIHNNQMSQSVEVLYNSFDSLLFDKELLSMLNYEGISHIRSLHEHKNFIAAWNELLINNSTSSENNFIAKLDQYNKELLNIVGNMVNTNTFQQFLKRKKQLKILKYTSTSFKIANTVISFLPIPGVNYIGAGLSMFEKMFEKNISSRERDHASLSERQSAAGLEILNTKKSGIHVKDMRGISSSTLN